MTTKIMEPPGNRLEEILLAVPIMYRACSCTGKLVRHRGVGVLTRFMDQDWMEFWNIAAWEYASDNSGRIL